jgi:hypothetical protein
MFTDTNPGRKQRAEPVRLGVAVAELLAGWPCAIASRCSWTWCLPKSAPVRRR